jgi:hypothetical protein
MLDLPYAVSESIVQHRKNGLKFLRGPGMELNRGLLKDATENGLISAQQADQLWKFLAEWGKDMPNLRFTHV